MGFCTKYSRIGGTISSWLGYSFNGEAHKINGSWAKNNNWKFGLYDKRVKINTSKLVI